LFVINAIELAIFNIIVKKSNIIAILLFNI